MAITAERPGARSPAPANAEAKHASDGGLHHLQFRALGTDCVILYSCDNDALAAAFGNAAWDWVTRFEARCTRFRDDSVIGRINATAGSGEWHSVDEEMERYFDVCDALHQWTNGLLDVTAGPLERLWDYRQSPPRVPAPVEIAAARAKVGWPKVERRAGAIRLPERGMALDFGGWGKEYAVDAVLALAREHGLLAALVDFGHDVAAYGQPPGRAAWHVGLEDPARPGALSGSVGLRDGAIASSGDYLRGFTLEGRRYGHILDLRTGAPVNNGCRQVTVIAPSCLQAGVLSTTAFILGPAEGLRLVQETMGAEARFVTSEAVYQTRGFFHHVVS